MLPDLKTTLNKLTNVGPAYLKRLEKLNLKTVEDLLFYWPHRYEDFSEIVPIAEACFKIGEKITIQGRITNIQNIRTWKKKMKVTTAFIEDETGVIKAIWFNQPFLTNSLRPGLTVSLSGKVALDADGPCLSAPVYELAKTSSPEEENRRHTGRLVPIYRETYGLSSKYLRYLIWPLLPLAEKIEEFLPEKVLDNQDLMGLQEAIRQTHFPESTKAAEEARRRLAFEELFLLQIIALKQKKDFRLEKAPAIPFNEKLIKEFVSSLPFKLTDSQRIAAWEILQDIAKPSPMNRLLNGDVGSGKTVVAIIAAIQAAAENYQTALMAPTEVLARQHFEGITNILKKYKIKIGLLTGNENKIASTGKIKEISREKIIEKIGKNEIELTVGTHALIQKQVNFKNLALAVVDEQHRFGVSQRAALQKNIEKISDGRPQTIPHLLSMTATPIPRTLALTVYGDLDISPLKELPKGRQKIITKIVAPASRQDAYEFIRKQIQTGRQAFVICPRIDNKDDSEEEKSPAQSLWEDVKAAVEEYDNLSKKIFPEFQLGLLHGKLKPKEKEIVMNGFSTNKIQILVSTSVIEVGIDVPNATVILIEGADKFGLAQLHQFRGRVGRGAHQSYCLLFSDSSSKKTSQRLKALLTAKNGFELAEKDLAIRGPGDFFGTRQWGLPDLAMASLNDFELIKKARAEAEKILEEDGNLKKYPLLLKKIGRFKERVHFE